MPVKHVFVDGLARLPAFCHATIAGDFIFVSGTLGTKPDSMELVPGGAGPEIKQALLNVRTILNQCGADLDRLTKVNVYMCDMNEFSAMNEAYLEIIGDPPPARISSGCTELALGASVEIDAVAYVPGLSGNPG